MTHPRASSARILHVFHSEVKWELLVVPHKNQWGEHKNGVAHIFSEEPLSDHQIIIRAYEIVANKVGYPFHQEQFSILTTNEVYSEQLSI